MRARLGITCGLFCVVTTAWIIFRFDPALVRVRFLGYTNYEGHTIALFGITNLLRHNLRGFAFAETNLARRQNDGQQLVTNLIARSGPRGPSVSTQVVWRLMAAPITEGRRDIWLGAVTNAPYNGMTLGLREPPRAWKLGLFFPPEAGAFSNTLRAKLAAFCQARGWFRISNRLQPKPKSLVVHGPELRGAQPK